MSISIEITGLRELHRNLKTLPDKVARKVVTQALRKGAKIIQNEAKRLVPVRTGALKSTIKTKVTAFPKKGQKQLIVHAGGGDEYYAHFIEYGHRIGKRSKAFEAARSQANRLRKTRTERGRAKANAIMEKARQADSREEVKPKPFIRPAFRNKKDEAEALIIREIAAGIEREAAAQT